MTISMSEQAFADLEEEMFARAQYPDPTDAADCLVNCPSWLATGHSRIVDLREGLELQVDNFRLRDRWDVARSEQRHWLSFHFHLSGQHQDGCTEVNNLEYAVYGSGMAPKDSIIGPSRYPTVEVTVSMSPEVFVSFIGRNGEVPPEFRHLVPPPDRLYYTRVGTVSGAMQRVLWQIFCCPYAGITKRMYLEGKVLEAAAMVLEEERQMQQGRQTSDRDLGNYGADTGLTNLKPDDIDRLHQAREILHRQLEQPPSIMDLAQQVGLNSRALKEGFRQVFGQPPFSYLHDRRLEQARHLLETREMKVAEVAAAVGFTNRSHFAEQFRAKFGLNPKLYQVQRRKFF